MKPDFTCCAMCDVPSLASPSIALLLYVLALASKMRSIVGLGRLQQAAVLAALVGSVTNAQDLSYSLVDNYTPSTFFDMFNFDTVR